MSPFDEGRLAAPSFTANPYAEGIYHHAEWSRGFANPPGEDFGSDAFEEGRRAAAAGHDRETNPFDIHVEADAEKFERWDAGFASAEEASDAAITPDQGSTEQQEESR